MKRTILTIAAALAASGCTVGSGGGSVGEQLGFTPTAPDEFLIIARKPLRLPPSMNLPRPQPGAPSRVELDPFSDAHASLFSRPGPIRLGAPSGGEQILLSGADAEGDNSVVRQALAADDPDLGGRQFGLTDLFGIPIPANLSEGDDVVRPVAETDLLRRQGFLTPTAPDGIEDVEQSDFIFSTRGAPTEEEIEASRDNPN
ncbi:MAG: DUF3035 domain-containing protein [Pseudomonadota bacterium]